MNDRLTPRQRFARARDAAVRAQLAKQYGPTWQQKLASYHRQGAAGTNWTALTAHAND